MNNLFVNSMNQYSNHQQLTADEVVIFIIIKYVLNRRLRFTGCIKLAFIYVLVVEFYGCGHLHTPVLVYILFRHLGSTHKDNIFFLLLFIILLITFYLVNCQFMHSLNNILIFAVCFVMKNRKQHQRRAQEPISIIDHQLHQEVLHYTRTFKLEC